MAPGDPTSVFMPLHHSLLLYRNSPLINRIWQSHGISLLRLGYEKTMRLSEACFLSLPLPCLTFYFSLLSLTHSFSLSLCSEGISCHVMSSSFWKGPQARKWHLQRQAREDPQPATSHVNALRSRLCPCQALRWLWPQLTPWLKPWKRPWARSTQLNTGFVVLRC